MTFVAQADPCGWMPAVCTHAYAHTCTRTNEHIHHSHTRMHACTHSRAHSNAYTLAHGANVQTKSTHAHTLERMHTLAQGANVQPITRTHAHTCTRTNEHIHHSRAYTRTHTHTRAHRRSQWSNDHSDNHTIHYHSHMMCTSHFACACTFCFHAHTH